MRNMNVKNVKSWRKLRDFVGELRDSNDEFLWRGQRDATWKLSSTIYRFFESQSVPQNDRMDYENRTVKFFQRRVKSARDLEIKISEKSEILVLMQHYGCPTCMLDWSKSPFVALYFAIEEQSASAALFGLNLTKYQALVGEKVALDDYDGSILSWIPGRVFGHLQRDRVTFPIPLVPEPITDREYNQQTAFLVDLQHEKPLEDCFLGDVNDYLWKLEFGRSMRSSIVSDLLSMNIDGYHLFQGLHGIALRSKEYLLGEKDFGYTTDDPNFRPL